MTRARQWAPRSLHSLQTYTLHTFLRDLIAGLTVGLVALPLAIAFAIASGVAPQAGIYTAIIAGFIISALGGSRTQIGGPTGAFVVIVAGIVAKFGLNGLALIGIMAGVLLLVVGLTGLGSAVKYIPRPVIVGFTNGIAVLIVSTQLKDFFGLSIAHVPSEFFARVTTLASRAGTLDSTTLTIAVSSLAIILVWPRLVPRIPGSIVALFLTTAAVAFFRLPVATVGSAFGGIPHALPHFAWPAFTSIPLAALVPAACTVAFLAAVESLLSATVADSMSGDRHQPNVELVAQGIANIMSPLFGGIPATGAIARTATNIRSGALTPVAGMFHAVVLLVIVLVAAPLAGHIPLATLAAVLLVVAYNMGEWHEIRSIVRLSKADIAVWLTTFALTVFADLTTAVGTGVVLAALLLIYRLSQTTTVSPVTSESIQTAKEHSLDDKIIPPAVSLLRIHGPFVFGTTAKLAEAANDPAALKSIVILRLRDMTALDATGIHALEQFHDHLQQDGRTLLVCGAMNQPLRLLAGSRFFRQLGPENALPNIEAALARVAQLQVVQTVAPLAL